eukprot:8550053-Lingulodinium_polyedra.AAC.1
MAIVEYQERPAAQPWEGPNCNSGKGNGQTLPGAPRHRPKPCADELQPNASSLRPLSAKPVFFLSAPFWG